ncbi:glycosyl transferase family 1 [Taibaiella sp. KBW10]|uniref:glycosyltransferase family 4 protein n=1 Tax=Taibaiella sp. KBW10 TaxID=2153357 RepID=UPI000F598ABA|nr:glycosyltransferase family 4 protein [Taibaiella sp. KBW10]RQO31998.1 glycosyl transferase family 1 [Taibaiella sp. KBW10]
MRILVLTNRVPYPLNDGGNLAVNNMLEGLRAQGAAITLLSMNTSRHWVDQSNFPALFTQLEQVATVAVDNHIKPLGALKSLLQGTSYNIARFNNAAFAARLKTLLTENTFDVVLLEGLFVCSYLPIIRQYSKAKIAYRQHNVEFQIWERMAVRAANPIKKWYLRQLARALKRFEIAHLNDYDLIAAISPVDVAHYKALGCTIPIISIPFSLPPQQITLQSLPRDLQSLPREELNLYHIGAMDWQPNVEGLLWFLEHVWPRVLAARPEQKFYLAGRNMPDRFHTGKWPGVIVAGEVPDAAVFEQDKSILVVPLHSGGGIRVKILQSMAKGKAVITTSIGLQGIEEAQNNQDVLVADTPEAFAQACISLLQDRKKVEDMGLQAHKLIQNNYNQYVVTSRLLKSLKEL